MIPRDGADPTQAALSPPGSAFADYFRCPGHLTDRVDTSGPLSEDEGFFTFLGATCYGRRRVHSEAESVACRPVDLPYEVPCRSGVLELPFDLSEVVRNLHQERYVQRPAGWLDRAFSTGASRNLYYSLRPILSVPLRRHLQRLRLNGWERIPFPQWPVDVSVDTLMRSVMALLLRTSGETEIPFVWFWPDGLPSAAIVTHDVEDRAGWAFTGQLMDIDEQFHIGSAFQLVPELPRAAPRDLFDEVRARGFEVNLHDLNHDGYLFHTRRHFLQRVARINEYGRQFGCAGFRSGAMYREQHWYDMLEFSYDMSVPNVAHLDPQRGGCCTVMPYFVGELLELPLTTIQDYTLFHILGDYSTALWEEQIRRITATNGLVSILTHPDYLAEPRALEVYRQLLAHLCELRTGARLWIAPPAEIVRWWRNRRAMRLVQHGREWRIEGPDSHRARIGYARLHGDALVFEVPEPGNRDTRQQRDGGDQ